MIVLELGQPETDWLGSGLLKRRTIPSPGMMAANMPG